MDIFSNEDMKKLIENYGQSFRLSNRNYENYGLEREYKKDIFNGSALKQLQNHNKYNFYIYLAAALGSFILFINKFFQYLNSEFYAKYNDIFSSGNATVKSFFTSIVAVFKQTYMPDQYSENSIKPLLNGTDSDLLAPLLVYSFLMTFIIITMILIYTQRTKRVKREISKLQNESFLTHEPLALKDKDFKFTDDGQDGKLIIAVLSARMIYNLTQDLSSAQINKDAIDAKTCELVESIIQSNKDGYMTEHVTRELEHFLFSADKVNEENWFMIEISLDEIKKQNESKGK